MAKTRWLGFGPTTQQLTCRGQGRHLRVDVHLVGGPRLCRLGSRSHGLTHRHRRDQRAGGGGALSETDQTRLTHPRGGGGRL